MGLMRQVITPLGILWTWWGGRRRATAMVLSVFLLLAVWVSPLLAGTPGKIGLLDMKRIEVESRAGKSTAKALANEKAKERDELKALDQEADSLRQTLSTLSAEERKAKERTLQEKVQAVERRKADPAKQREAVQQELTRDFRNRVKAVVATYAKEEGFAAVFIKGKGMFYADDSLDITGAIIERLNAPGAKSADGGEATPTPKP